MKIPVLMQQNNSQLVHYTNNNFINNYLNSFNWDQILATLTSKVITIVLLSLLFLIIARVGRSIIYHIFHHADVKKAQHPDPAKSSGRKRSKTIYSLLQNAYNYVIIFFWLYSILSVMGIPVGTLIAGAGIFSLAIGLGAQGFVSDIVSGFFILSERQIEVGEHVTINAINGFVSAVGLRTTQIRSADGTLNFIPNRNITSIANLSRGNLTTLIDIRITPDAPIKKIETIMDQVNEDKAGKDHNVIGDPLVFGTVYLADGSLAVQACITCKSGSEDNVQADYLQAYLTALQQAGIELPLSPQTVQPPKKPTPPASSQATATPFKMK
ncbi:mechanosensitive ion channel family protein [Fructilactobacillus myrtifloralis]|uniref:Mechanosensitive ion channel family protein n=1 Tax=Fructilactobacillus myrtifloralis TaxID=2940301 RepID=A0ABY5BRI8_9LACO|nr:mechanosensitive ion channel family protein [Fructilactobacillus myrtifloralis]USS85196.1 mechanosensitive ion channel family protein [Fructilactobacillus myrtifloralis]